MYYSGKVESIELDYTIDNTNAFEHMSQSGKKVYTTESELDFKFPCLNKTCTSKWIDLTHSISMLVMRGVKEADEIVECEGDEYPVRRNQRAWCCGGKVRYHVRIKYSR